MNTKYFAASNQMIPALNAMIDVTNSRYHGELYKVPDVIIGMLLFLLIITSFIYGYTTETAGRKVDWQLSVFYCLFTALIIYFILDMDRPRRGLINLDSSIQTILDVRKMLE